MKNLAMTLTLFAGLSAVAFAAGPTLQPRETSFKLPAEVLSLLSDARVAKNLHTAASRHALKLIDVTLRVLNADVAECTFKFENGQHPPTFAQFAVKVGDSFSSTGTFKVLAVGELSIAAPVIEPRPRP